MNKMNPIDVGVNWLDLLIAELEDELSRKEVK